MLATWNYVNYSTRNTKRSAKYVYHTGTLALSTARAGTSCVKEEGPINNWLVIRWTFFHSLSTSSRKEDLMDIDIVESRETRNTLRLTNRRRSARRIISRVSMIDSYEMKQFVNWMIENGRDEECLSTNGCACGRRSYSPLDPSRILSLQEVIGGFVRTRQVPILCLEHRSDFKQAVSTLQQFQREAEGDPQVPTYSNRSQQWAQSSSTWWNWQGSLWTPYPSESHDGDAPSLEWTGWLVVDCSTWKDSSG